MRPGIKRVKPRILRRYTEADLNIRGRSFEVF